MDGLIERLYQMWYNRGREGVSIFPGLAVLSAVTDGAAFFVFNEILNISKNVEIVGNVGKWHSR